MYCLGCFGKTEILSENYPIDPIDDELLTELKEQLINTLSEKRLSLSETRYLFSEILECFERIMPVTNVLK